MKEIILRTNGERVAIVFDPKLGLEAYGPDIDSERFHQIWGGSVLHQSDGAIEGWVPASDGRYPVLGYSTRTLNLREALDGPRFGQLMLHARGGGGLIVAPYTDGRIAPAYPVVLASCYQDWVLRGALHVDELRPLQAGKLLLHGEHHQRTYWQPEGRLGLTFDFGASPHVPRRHLSRVQVAFAREMVFRGEVERHPFWATLELHPQAHTQYLFRLEDGVAVERYTDSELSDEASLRRVAPSNVSVIAADCVLAKDPDQWRIYWRDGAFTNLPSAEANRLRAGGDRGLARMFADQYTMLDGPRAGILVLARELWHQGHRDLAALILGILSTGREGDRDALLRMLPVPLLYQPNLTHLP